ncbi:predicted protein [Naegleria gruberi]|uniref:Predicted protein n=1 Tax=Naegleria gruberi TaxID=5762 RepID=D2VFW5_NAEGR|nr:uncharacterized protein NAEGRDRAFT_67768 [Naegleria gruberi]EFC44152.1 predicted protein [Naegleria gruberi]|eukprot:XP_002676896.1 predicted protein [Naegleria gruberi strain NEG-M]
MRLLLSGQHFLKPLLSINELLDQIIDYLDYPSIICLSMSNKSHFGINTFSSITTSESSCNTPSSSLLTLNPNLWVNLVIRYDCVGELISKFPSLSGLEDVEAMNERERMDFSLKCREILSEHVLGKLKKYKLKKLDENDGKQLCQVCGELIEMGELIVLHVKEGKVACFYEYFHWNCLDMDEMNRIKMKRCEIEYTDSNNYFLRKQVENFYKKVDESREVRRQKLFGIVCDSCLKFQSSRYYSGLDSDSNRVDLCMNCYSNERATSLTSIEKRKPSLITCSTCKEPIKNAIFSCQYCDYYSLCQNCFEQLPKTSKHSSHPFTLVGCCIDTLESNSHTSRSETTESKKRKYESNSKVPNKKVSLLDVARNMGFDLT